MRRPEVFGEPHHVPEGYLQALRSVLARWDIHHVGVAPAEVMERARGALHDRIDRGFSDVMRFTFKNPERSTDPQAAVAGARSVLVAARAYPTTTDDNNTPAIAGRVARYAWHDHYAPLREGLWAVAHRLRADGWKAVAFADDNSIVDREAAYRAGLGWFGKNANLLIPGAGSWFVLGCVVTTAPFDVTEAPVADGCGPCHRCIDACPTGAIVSPGVIDARRCLAWVLQKPGVIDRALRSTVGDRMYGCDDCQTSCPPSMRPADRPEVSSVGPRRSTVDVLEVLEADDDAVISTWGRWYLADRDPRWVRRNALVVLGNAAHAAHTAHTTNSTHTDDPRNDMARSATNPESVANRVAAALAHYLAHHDAVLRAHAVWAAAQWSMQHLMPATDPDPLVADELQLVAIRR